MAKDKEFDVLGFGVTTVDFIGTIKGWPQQDSKVLLDSLVICDGGLVGNAITAAAVLGGKAAFAGKLGTSSLSNRALKSLADADVDCSQVIRHPGAEPMTAIVFTDTENGKRNIFFSRDSVSYPLPYELPDQNWFKKTSVLLVDYESGIAGVEMAKIAFQNELDVVLDIESEDENTADLIQYSNHLVISNDFRLKYCGSGAIEDALRKLKVTERHNVIITQGEKGCDILTVNNEYFHLPAFKVDVVDTTGCGDVFHGAYAVRIAKGYTVYQAAVFASAAAALCATKIGGRAGVPTKQQVDEFLN